MVLVIFVYIVRNVLENHLINQLRDFTSIVNDMLTKGFLQILGSFRHSRTFQQSIVHSFTCIMLFEMENTKPQR